MVTVLTPTTTTRHRVPVSASGHISVSASALERIVTRMYRLGKVDGVRETCELMDELVFDDEGDALATIAPALAGMGISEAEVSR